MKNFVCLAGLPRSGSTLLSSVLSQNPEIYTSSSSPLCDMLWNSEMLWRQQLALGANNNDDAVIRVMSSMIPQFYADKKQSTIIDKSFYWGLFDNLELVRRFAPVIPKFIVMNRDINDVANSLTNLFLKNPQNKLVNENDIQPFTYEKIYKSLLAEGGHLWKCNISKQNIIDFYSSDSVIVDYERFCIEPNSVIKEIYSLLKLENFPHQYLDINNSNLDNDDFWGIPGMHTIRPTIESQIKFSETESLS
jgi:sulfotransferase